ncbi:MAG: site-2 protease family protein [Planctomycetota bacterium]
MCLMAASSLADFGGNVLSALTAAAGLGFVIFVHELGHFAVARMCGVKCEKFMVGFDFWGLKLSRRWGETEYGIGVFPLGGYVKMLGQDDDPSKAAEQLEASRVEEGSEYGKEVIGPDGQKRLVDRRSYQAKAVWQRMAIISAGVVMNMIFAFIFAFLAFGLGVKYLPCVISQTSPGAPAWQAGLEAGDELVQIGDRRDPSFKHLSSYVTLGDMQTGVAFRVRRRGAGSEEERVLKPKKLDGLAKIGVAPPRSNRFFDDKKGLAALAEKWGLPDVRADDEVVAIGGTAVDSYAGIIAALVAQPTGDIDVTVLRKTPAEQPSAGAGDAPEQRTEVTLSFADRRARTLGLTMAMGPIVAIQQGSPAEAAGLKPGDQIVAIDGESVALAGANGLDPETLGERLAVSRGVIELTIVPEGEDPADTSIIMVTPRPVSWVETPGSGRAPMPLPALGLCYRIEPTVAGVVPGSPADEAGIKPGDQLASVTFINPPVGDNPGKAGKPATIGGKKGVHIPATLDTVKRLREGAQVELKIKRADEVLTKKLTPAVSEESYLAERELAGLLGPILRERVVTSVSEQAAYAADETWFSLTTVVRFVQKLFSQQVAVDKLGGPITILRGSFLTASVSTSEFLLFLTMLSANLAVLNFLPIPVLDGGHMVFLAWEGITGKPANERLAIALQLVGVAMLLSLMLFVTYNDIARLVTGG